MRASGSTKVPIAIIGPGEYLGELAMTLVRSLAERLSASNDIIRRNSIVDSKVSDSIRAAEQRAGVDKKLAKPETKEELKPEKKD